MKKCPNCGCVTDSPFCGQCGTDLRNIEEYVIAPDSSKPVIPHIDVAEDKGEEQVVEVTTTETPATDSTKSKPKKKGLIIGIVVVVLIAIIAVIVLAGKASAKEEYKKTFATVKLSMGVDASIAEEACNLISSVWYDAIFENTNEEETKKYVAGAADFDEALLNLYSDEEFQTKINGLKEGQENIDRLMGELKNPPDEYKEAYNYLLDVYTDYSEFTELAINPTGSYKSYTERFHELDSQLAKELKKLDAITPE